MVSPESRTLPRLAGAAGASIVVVTAALPVPLGSLSTVNFNMISRDWTPIVLGPIWFNCQGPQHDRRVLRNFLVQCSRHDEGHLPEATLDFFIQTGHALFVGC